MSKLTPSFQFDFKSIIPAGPANAGKNTTPTLVDRSLNQVNGAVDDGCSILGDPIVGECMAFLGTGGVKLDTLPNSGATDFSQAITMTAYVNTGALNNACLLSLTTGAGSGSNLSNLSLQVGNGQPFFEQLTAGNTAPTKKQVLSNTPIDQGSWCHLAVTVTSGGDAYFYVNGQPTTGQPQTPGIALANVSHTDNAIGQGLLTNATNAAFQGKMAWLSIYNTALSPGQVVTDMNNAKAAHNVITPIVEYDFKKIYTQTNPSGPDTLYIKDHSGNQLNATIEGNCTKFVDPIMGDCLNFDGSTGYVKGKAIGTTSATSLAGGMTICCWFYTVKSPPGSGYMPSIIDMVAGGANSALFSLSYLDNPCGFTIYPTPYSNPAAQIYPSVKNTGWGDQWVHVAVTLSPVDNTIKMCANGEEIDSGSFTWNTTQVFEHVSLGKGLSLDKLADLFKGNMAWLTIYNAPLEVGQVKADMLKGSGNRIAPFRKSFPINFDVYSKNNTDEVPVLYIRQEKKGKSLHLKVTNNTNNPLSIGPSTAAKATFTEFHFQLCFRPGTLSDYFLSTPISTPPTGWSVVAGTDPVTSIEYISFLKTGSAAPLAPKASLSLEVNGVNANGIGGARNTNVVFNYKLGSGLIGERMQSMSIVNELGQKDIPMHADVVGAPAILNNSNNSNSLLFRLENTGINNMELSTDSIQPSKFVVSLLTQPEDEMVEWALIKESAKTGVTLNWPILGVIAKVSTGKNTLTLEEPISTQLAINTKLNIQDSTGTTTTVTLKSGVSAGKKKIPCNEALNDSMTGSIVSLASDLGTVETATTNTNSVTLAGKLTQAIPSGTLLTFDDGATEVSATLATKAKVNDTSLSLKNDHSIPAGAIVALASPLDIWNITEQSQTGGVLQWTITNQALGELVPGGSIEFLIRGIVCDLPAGQSFITVNYYNIPGYWDGKFIIPIQKSPIIYENQHVGVGMANKAGSSLQVAYPSDGTATTSALVIGGSTVSSSADQSALEVLDITGAEQMHISNDGHIHTKSGITTVGDIDAGASVIKTTGDITTNGGNIGIGDTSPNFPLEIDSTALPQIKIKNGTTTLQPSNTTLNNELQLGIRNTGVSTIYSDNGLLFGALQPDKDLMMLTRDGKLGIGIDNPFSMLHINDPGGPATQPTSTSVSMSNGIIVSGGVGGGAINVGTASSGCGFIQSSYVNNVGTNLPLSLNPNGGPVGIGTQPVHTDPTALTISNTTSPQLNITNPSAPSGSQAMTFGVESTGQGRFDSEVGYAFCNNGTKNVHINSKGYIGVGRSPKYPFDTIKGSSLTYPADAAAYQLQTMGINNYANDSVTGVGIHSRQAMVSFNFVASSDARIKDNLALSDSAADLKKLLRLKVTDYQYKDKIAHGTKMTKGLIAQELEQLFPEAVMQYSESTPDVYAPAKKVEWNKKKKELTIYLEKKHKLKVGDLLTLITEDQQELEKEVVAVPHPKTVVVKDWTENVKGVFVFGKSVDDFRGINYHQVAMLGISATQQIHKELEVTQKENKKLKKECKQLKAQLEDEMGSLRAELKALKNLISKQQ